MDKFCNDIDGLSLEVKILLALPFVDIVWWIYRICKSAFFNDMLGLVIAIIVLIVGVPFMWLIDIICLALNKKVLWFDYSSNSK